MGPDGPDPLMSHQPPTATSRPGSRSTATSYRLTLRLLSAPRDLEGPPPPPTSRPFPTTTAQRRVIASVPLPAVTDATSTETPDWWCIEQAESSGNAGDPDGLFGILAYVWQDDLGYSGEAGEYPVATQDEGALRLYAMYGWQPWISDVYKCPFV
jgi:hypothetical protein